MIRNISACLGLKYTLVACLCLNSLAYAEVLHDERFESTPTGDMPEGYFAKGIPIDAGSIYEAFSDFHIYENIDFVGQVRDSLESQTALSDFTFSGNVGGLFDTIWWPEFISVFDYLNTEIGVSPSNIDLEMNLVKVKVAESLERQVFLMPNAASNSEWQAASDTKSFFWQVALSYALGHNFHVPFGLYTGSIGNRWYGDPSDYAEIFEFIQDRPDLFDDFVSLPTTVILVPYHQVDVDSDRRAWLEDSNLHNTVGQFYADSTPFSVVPVGPGLPDVDESFLYAHKRFVVIGNNSDYSASHRSIITGRPSNASSDFLQPVLSNKSGIKVFPRIKRDGSIMNLHLVRTEVSNASDVVLTIEKDFVTIPSGADVKLYRADTNSVTSLSFSSNSSSYTITVPQTDYWSILSIEISGNFSGSGNPIIKTAPDVIDRSVVPIMRIKQNDVPSYLHDLMTNTNQNPWEVYHANYVSWNYDKNLKDYFNVNNGITNAGLKCIGSYNLSNETFDATERPESWAGWSRDASGDAMLDRTDFANVKYYGNWSSTEFLNRAIEENEFWGTTSASGFQWDGSPGYVHGVFQDRGGNYASNAIDRFSEFLERYDSATLSSWGVASLTSTQIVSALEDYKEAALGGIGVSSIDRLTIPLVDPNSGSPNRWVFTPAFSSNSDEVFVKVRVRQLNEAGGKGFGLYLWDGAATVFAASVHISSTVKVYSNGALRTTGISVPSAGAIYELKVRYDFANKRLKVAINNGAYSNYFDFRTPSAASKEDFSIAFLAKPDRSTIQVDRVYVNEL